MAFNLDKGKKNAKDINEILSDINQKQEASLKIEKERLRIEKERLATDKNILSDQQDISNVIKDQTKQLKFQKAEKSAILRATNSITRISENLSSLTKDELIDQKALKKLSQDKIKVDKNINLLKQTQAKLQSETAGLTEAQIRSNVELAGSIDDQINNAIQLKVELGLVNNITENISKAKGVRIFDGIEKVLDKVPLLSGLAPSFGAAASEARDIAADLEKKKFGVDKFEKLVEEGMKVEDAMEAAGITTDDLAEDAKGAFSKAAIDSASMKAAMKSISNSLLKSLGPLAMLMKLVEALVAGDKAAADMAKSMNISYTEALAMRKELRDASIDSMSLFVNTRGMAESMAAINQSLGTNVMLNTEMLVQMTEMREMAGFTNEELAGIAAISLTTGKSMNDITGEFMAQAQISAQQNGVLLNEKDLLRDIGKVSAATTLSFAKNPKLIAEAVATAKSLGMELSKVDNIANSLLDFESSIANELEAELLLNKDINLEKARQAALNNDLATVAREISEQVGSSAEFAAMNRIQQEALAKSVGMNRDDLAETLFIQEQLAGATGDEAKEKEALLQKRIQEVGLAQAQEELAQKGIDGLREQVGMADKMAAATERINEIFGMIGESMLPVFEIFGGIFEIVNAILIPFKFLMDGAAFLGEQFSNMIGPLGTVGKLLKGLVGAAIVYAAYATFAAVSTALAATIVGGLAAPIVGGIAAAAVLAAGFGALSKVGDLKIDPNGGPIVASPREGGIFQGTKNDALRMAPPSALDGGTTVAAQSTDMSATNALLEKLVNKTPEMAPLGLYEVQ